MRVPARQINKWQAKRGLAGVRGRFETRPTIACTTCLQDVRRGGPCLARTGTGHVFGGGSARKHVPRAWHVGRYALGMLRRLLVVLFVLFVPRLAHASPFDFDEDDVVAPDGQRISPRARGSTSLSLVGFTHEKDNGSLALGGMVVLALPLDRYAAGSTRTTDYVRVAQTAPASSDGVPFDIALSPRLARACVNAAWQAAGIGADDARLESIVSRARWSAILPETRLRAIRYDSASLYSSLDPLGSPTYFRDTTGGNLGLEARLTWRFDRLVYADDEPAIERIRLEQRDARTRIAGKALEMLFHWQRALLDLRTLPPAQAGTRDEADVVLRIMEAESALDVITNGWFSTHKPKRGVSSSM